MRGVIPTIDAGAPYYLYGHRREMNIRLIQKDKNKDLKKQKYPLIILRLDTVESVAKGMISYSLNVGILMLTDPNYPTAERYDVNFRPILYPLYDLFMQKLRESPKFTWAGDQKRPEHKKIDRPFYGTAMSEGNSSYLFNDPIDAIEIVDLKFNQRLNC